MRGQVGRNLQTADPVAVDERGPIMERLRSGVGEGVDDLATEGVHSRREPRLAKPAGRQDDRIKPLSVDRPSRVHLLDRRVEADVVDHSERARVGVEIGLNLLGRRMQRMLSRRREVGERGHRPARVRVHPRPHTAVGSRRVPLAAQHAARLEHGHVEADLQRMLGGHDAGRAGSDDRDPSSVAQPHWATVLAAVYRRLSLMPLSVSASS